MAILKWDEVSKRLYHAGVKKTVLYVQAADGSYPEGVAWSGVSAINEAPSGAESNPIYADDIKYLDLRSTEQYGATIECYMHPDEFYECDGSTEIVPGVRAGQQGRKSFGLSYVTTLGNDTENENYGYIIHLIYGAKANPSDKGHSTINESIEAGTLSYEIATTPVDPEIAGVKPLSTIEIESTKFTSESDKAKLKALEDLLYGTSTDKATLPDPKTVFQTLGWTAK